MLCERNETPRGLVFVSTPPLLRWGRLANRPWPQRCKDGAAREYARYTDKTRHEGHKTGERSRPPLML